LSYRRLALIAAIAVAGCTPSAQNASVLPPQPIIVVAPRVVHSFENAPVPFTLNATEEYVIERRTGTVLYEYNSDARVQPGSLAKLMTFYLTLDALSDQRISKDSLVTIGADVAELANDPTLSRMRLMLGQQVTVQDLLFGMMVHSGCDAAQALADYVGGNSAKFVSMMNDRARRLGMNNTNFAKPNGLPVPGEYTTAADMTTLARAIIMQHPEAFIYTSRRSFKFNRYNQTNTNRLLLLDARVNGLKTGHVREAGFHLVASAETGNLQVISVVLGAPSDSKRISESYRLIDWTFNTFTTVAPDWHSALPSSIPVQGGNVAAVTIAPERSPLFTVAASDRPYFQFRADISRSVSAPVQKGQVIGNLIVSRGDQKESIPVETTSTVDSAATSAAHIDEPVAKVQ
jgi:D-alanyl-D-alanine carboxypeptidase (penicillin-binding protein 5/6)